MTCLEHYFENYLYKGDYDDPNKEYLTKEQMETARKCADYVLYTLFWNRQDILNVIGRNIERRNYYTIADEYGTWGYYETEDEARKIIKNKLDINRTTKIMYVTEFSKCIETIYERKGEKV